MGRSKLAVNIPSDAPKNVSAVLNDSLKDPRVRRALQLTRQHPALKPKELAGIVNLSPSRFRHLFKKEVGVSPGHFVKLCRLKRTEELVQQSFLTIKEIAVAVGANDVSHLVRDYKAFYGQTPTETRMLSKVAPSS
jgi:transcriptional regulator GlxA family with amidase domain